MPSNKKMPLVVVEGASNGCYTALAYRFFGDYSYLRSVRSKATNDAANRQGSTLSLN